MAKVTRREQAGAVRFTQLDRENIEKIRAKLQAAMPLMRVTKTDAIRAALASAASDRPFVVPGTPGAQSDERADKMA